MIKMFPEEKQKIIFANHKRKIGIGYTIYVNSTIIGYTPSITNKGLRLPLEIGKYFILPKCLNEQFDLNVTFEFESPIGITKLVDVKSELYLEKIEYSNGKKIRIPRDVVYLKPYDISIHRQLRDLMDNYKKIYYTIRNQLEPTDYFSKIRNIRNVIPSDFDLRGLELITVGGLQKAQYEIYRNEENQLFVKMETSIRRWGKITLSSELRNHITDFFTFNELVCKKDDNYPMIISTFPRVIDKRTVFEIRLPHFSEEKKEITIIFTHPNFSLTETAKKDYQTTYSLKKMGYPIKSFYTQYNNGRHHEADVEQNMRKLVKRAFTSRNLEIIPDVQIMLDYPMENSFGNKHAFDDLIINKNDNSLILVEYKTSFGRNTKYRETDYAIAELFHFQRKFGGTVVLVLLINGDLYSNNVRITRQFGEDINIVLVGKHELIELNQKPSLLKDRVNFIKEKMKNKPNRIKKFQATILSKSLMNLPLVIRSVLENNKNILFSKMPNHFSFNTTTTINNSGGDFEQEMLQILSKEGFEIVPNLVINYFNRKMEIDMIAFRGGEFVVISCRNAVNVNCLMSFKLDIKQKAHKIEHRMRLLNADAAHLYLKVSQQVYNKVKQFEGTWIKSVEIIFIVI